MISIITKAEWQTQSKDKNEQDQKKVVNATLDIIQNVRTKGDSALLEYTKKFDKAELESLKVTQQEIDDSYAQVSDELKEVLQQAAQNIRAFHEKQVRQGFIMTERSGVVMGQRILPLQSVGIYVPGGTAAYPSTVLMDAIPAKVAGVERIVMVTPPSEDGTVKSAEVLAAAKIAGVTEIYKVGGAQAVAALAYSTQTIPQVDKIVGPGNIYVATAKQLVYGQVDIDMIAGPSDILIVADETANPVYLAADLLGQAEHDVNASAVMVTTSPALAQQVQQELEKQLERLPRKEIAGKSIANNGKIILVSSLEEALEVANKVAPEHLELCVEDPFSWLPLVRNAGSVFLGNNTPEALGDYLAGPNHTLPTGGTSRFSSPLSVDDFIKKSSYLYYSKQALTQDGNMVRKFAQSEGLDAHANSVTLRVAPEEAL